MHSRIYLIFAPLIIMIGLVLSAYKPVYGPNGDSFQAFAGAAQSTSTPSQITATPDSSDPGKEIKIGILVPQSGNTLNFGTSVKEGAELAIDEWNAKGGVLGSKIVPIIEDTQCNADGASNAANIVILKDNVHYIIGDVCSNASIAISKIANDRGVLQISPTSTNPGVTMDENNKVKPFIFRTCFIDPYQGTAAANFAINTLKFKTAYVLLFDPSNDYVTGLATAFKSNFSNLGGEVVGSDNYDGSKNVDFSTIMANIKKAKPDMIYLPDYDSVVNSATKSAKSVGITAPFMGGDGWDSLKLDLKFTNGDYYTNHYAADNPDPAVVKFIKAYGIKYKAKNAPKAPDALAVLAYDTTNLLLQSITEAGVDDPAKARDAMEDINFTGVTGKISFDEQHNPIKPVVILQIKGGKVVFKTSVNP